MNTPVIPYNPVIGFEDFAQEVFEFANKRADERLSIWHKQLQESIQGFKVFRQFSDAEKTAINTVFAQELYLPINKVTNLLRTFNCLHTSPMGDKGEVPMEHFKDFLSTCMMSHIYSQALLIILPTFQFALHHTDGAGHFTIMPPPGPLMVGMSKPVLMQYVREMKIDDQTKSIEGLIQQIEQLDQSGRTLTNLLFIISRVITRSGIQSHPIFGSEGQALANVATLSCIACLFKLYCGLLGQA